MGNSDVHKASELIARIVQPKQADEVRAWSAFYQAWIELAGDFYSAHTRPVDLRNGVLVIEADHPGWIQRMQFDQNRLLKAIQRRFPSLKIRGIAFRAASDSSLPGTAPYRAPYSGSDGPAASETSVDETGTNGTAASKTVEEVLEAVDNPEFRSILDSVAKTLREKRKDKDRSS